MVVVIAIKLFHISTRIAIVLAKRFSLLALEFGFVVLDLRTLLVADILYCNVLSFEREK